MTDDLRPQLLTHALTAWDSSEVDVRTALSQRLAVAFHHAPREIHRRAAESKDGLRR